MEYSYQQINILAGMLEDEIAGIPVDYDKLKKVAAELIEVCPEISGTMLSLIDRVSVPCDG